MSMLLPVVSSSLGLPGRFPEEDALPTGKLERHTLESTLSSGLRSKGRLSVQEEEHLLSAAREGDEDAFSSLVKRLGPQLYGIAFRTVKSVEDAEDIVQQTFLKAWRMLPGFRGESLFRTWITRILLNEGMQLLRRGSRQRLTFSDALPLVEAHAIAQGRLDAGASPEEEFLRADQRYRLRHAISKLPRSLRLVLEFELQQGRGCEEISASMGISVAAVKSRRLRARAELMKRLTRQIEKVRVR
jgi:RNA polymerase sigma-70 factor (ECF subfamily)